MGIESYNLGRKGEEIAQDYLMAHGYRIIEQNFRSRRGEIDIIAHDREVLVFIEVKNYSYRSFVSPAQLITRDKKHSIICAARYYLYRYKIRDRFCRFDVLTIYRGIEGQVNFELYKNAFFIR